LFKHVPNHLIYDDIRLYAVGVWIVVVVYEVWMKMWKYEFLVKNEFDDDFMMKWGYEFMFVGVLIAFWCILTNNNVWGMNLGQRGSKLGFLWKIGIGSREETQNLGVPNCCSSLGELELAMASFPRHNPWFWVSREVGGHSGLS
jgi:hypothetical protein